MSIAADRPGAPGALVSDSLQFARRRLAHVRQVPEKLIDVTVQPLIFTLLFAVVFGNVIHVPGGSYRSYLVAGVLVQTLTFGMMGPATSIATDIGEGIVDRFRSLPTTGLAYLAGHVIAELAAACVAVVVLALSGLAIGWRPHPADGAHALAAVALVIAYAAAMIWFGTLLGLLVRSPDAVMGLGFIVVFPLTFVSNAFVPLEGLPHALRAAAAWNPVSVVVAAVRTLLGTPTAPPPDAAWPLLHPVAAALLALVVLAAAVPLTLRAYARRVAG